ncbi:DUF4397 domain-containing protein [Corallincola spongiicola]|uniref:DUF4397 domain-containing protein n=1 Tax=Corallincola spongiicola TaxID=2520508 RepID=A0ABY1WLD4_9GAMM|nr:DUF4397 domain-containing protein [Corallincola spongiicola]TAA41713.1 DUF4397 domain-containing protein [Corallincola spongiicola]
MFITQPMKLTVVLLSGLFLFACDDSDDDSSGATTMQVYNVSSNSSPLTYEFDDSYTLSDISFSDATSPSTVNSGTYSLVISGVNSNGVDDEIYDGEVSLSGEQRHLFISAGDYSQLELYSVEYNLDDLGDDTMRLFVADYSTDSPGYDIYLGESGLGFELASLISTTAYGEAVLVGDYGLDVYDVYLTSVGNSEVLFTAENVSLTGETAYFLVVRDSFGATETGIAIDKVLLSSTVIHYEDNYANAQYRVINVSPDAVSTSLKSGDDEVRSELVAAKGVTEYEILPYGDYSLSIMNEAEEVLLNNLLISMPQNATKGIAVYQDEAGATQSIAFEESVRAIAFNSDITLANLSYDLDDVDVYFVPEGETLESTDYDAQDLDFEELTTGVLPSGFYQISVVLERDDDSMLLLYQSDILEFAAATNYSLLLFKDDTAEFGYDMAVVSN